MCVLILSGYTVYEVGTKYWQSKRYFIVIRVKFIIIRASASGCL
jgi:hypothetical protein